METGTKDLLDLKTKMTLLDDDKISIETRAQQLEEMLEKEKIKDKELDRQIKIQRENRTVEIIRVQIEPKTFQAQTR